MGKTIDNLPITTFSEGWSFAEREKLSHAKPMRLIVENQDADALYEYLQKKVDISNEGHHTDCWIWKGVVGGAKTPIFVYRNSRGTTSGLSALNLIVRVIHKTEVLGRGIKTACNVSLCVNPEHIDYKPSFALTVVAFIEDGDKEGLVEYLKNTTEEAQDEKWEGSPCWTASHATNCNGYILVRAKGKQALAHRLIAEFLSGEDVKNSVVHHRCSNKACLNPDHYQITTQQANTAEMLAQTYYAKRISDAESIMAELLNTLPEGVEREKVEAFLLAA